MIPSMLTRASTLCSQTTRYPHLLHSRSMCQSTKNPFSESIIPHQGGKIGFSKEISSPLIKKLLAGEIDLIRIPKYCQTHTCERATANLLNRDVEDYANAPGVGKVADVGIAFFETMNNPELQEKYYRNAAANMRILREIFRPDTNPLDRLRLELDEQWGAGAHLLRLKENQPMFAGLVRVLNREVLPHEDKLERDFQCTKDDLRIYAQMAVNIYMRVPKVGGEIVLWDESLSDDEYNRLRGNSYGIDRRLLPKPKVTIKPEVGDLVLFNPRKLHAVNPSEDKDDKRVSYSCFIGFGGEERPLQFWS